MSEGEAGIGKKCTQNTKFYVLLLMVFLLVYLLLF